MTPHAPDLASRPLSTPRPAAPGQRRGLWAGLAIVVLLIGGFVAYRYGFKSSDAAAASGSPGEGGGRSGEGKGRALPVVASKARSGDFPVYLDALGTVTALNTVTIRPRVDGEVTKVLYAEGQTVKQGDLLVEIDPRQYQAALEQAQGQLAKDQAQLKNAQADVERYNAAKETVSQQQIDTAAANKANYEGAIKVDQGMVDNANLQLSFCKITAPMSGKIGLRLVDEGNVVHASDSTGLATLTQLQPIAVVFNLPEVNLPSVLEAQHGPQKLIADVFNADRSKRLASGALEAIDNQIDVATATVKIKAVFPNADGMLFPNQFVNVRLKVRTIQNATLVATGAVQRSPDTMFVYVVKSDDTVEVRPVIVGPAEGTVTVIEKGLEPGEVVVTEGLDKLAPGMSVKVHGPATQPGDDPVAAPTSRPGAHGRGQHGQAAQGEAH